MSDGTLRFDTRIDTSGFERGMSDIESRTSRVGDIIWTRCRTSWT